MEKILKFLKKIGIFILNFLISQAIFIGAAIIGYIVGLIWGGTAGFFTFFGIGVAFVLYIMLRQLYWWITKTGDYDETKYPKK